ncbi:MAG TPA: PspA/IM30 family protein [Spirochaetia bacterium]|nr:PspA/IM30 family protein [Spirochaetia bacterium]
MGIFDRFKRVVKSNLNEMISKAENPEKMLNQLIVDMNQQLIESKKAVASAIADEKRLERELGQNRAQGEEWERKAMLAVRAGKDDLAKEALVRKQEYENYTGQYQQQWESQHQAVEKLKEALRGLQQKIEEAQRKKNLLIARAKRAEAQKKIQETIGGMSDTSAFDVFDRMTAKVDQIEAEADAMGELDDMRKDNDLESQFKALEGGGANADMLLEDLKKRMSIEGPGAAKSAGPTTDGKGNDRSSGGDSASGGSPAEGDEALEALKRKMRDEAGG